MIIGVFGACRRQEICDITMDFVRDNGTELYIQIPESKTDIARSFIITNDLYTICKKYISLRPKNVTNNKFFLNFQKGKCTSQSIGKKKIGGVPKEIATYLGLSNPEMYTGHCFRRSGATLLADSGADITTIMRFGEWKSSTVAAGYIEDSLGNKRKIFHSMANVMANDLMPPVEENTTSGNESGFIKYQHRQLYF